ncbi:MAG TPA: hypothetical protein H9909_06030 [Candidatus Mediterraneibacter norfolkensis]|nr:hypothetical protein [Candidatus Mediterraneibacter norfolkensis]
MSKNSFSKCRLKEAYRIQRDICRDLFEESRSSMPEDSLYYVAKEYEAELWGVLLFLARLEVISSEEYKEEVGLLKELFVDM